MRKLVSVSILIGLTALWGAGAADAQTPAGLSVTGAASGAFPAGATLFGLPVGSFIVGQGLRIFSDDAASGRFEVQLQVTTLLGLQQTITVESDVVSGSFDALGNATFRGLSHVDLGDGSVPLIRIPVVVSLAQAPDGSSSLALTIAGTVLPAAPVTVGTITVQAL
jgi:hypothetical protein